MNILILNGSPTGDGSITLQTMLYIQKLFPGHEYHVINVSQKIKRIEKDFAPSREALEAAELIVFCYPVYTFLVPAQLHRFIELMKAEDLDLSGKYATQVSTSKHFYDTTAHEFIRENCADLGLRYIPGLSADMEDLLRKKGQREAEAFFRHVLWAVENDSFERVLLPSPKARNAAADIPGEPKAVSMDKRAVIVTDLAPEDAVLDAMIKRFIAAAPFSCAVVDLRQFPFAGGCLGCFHCASDGKCVYRDNFDSFLRENIQTADATVYAFTIRDHSMGYRFKLYDDRQFCNGHRTVTMGKPVAYLVNGDVSAEPNLTELINARAQVGRNHLAGIACSVGEPDRDIDALAAELAYALENDFQQPANFYGVGGMKIFRDLIFQMQGLMREDHRFYKKHGFYDFPQKRVGTVLGMYLVGGMMTNRKLSKKLGGSMTKGMLMPYRAVIDRVKGPVPAPDHRAHKKLSFRSDKSK